MDEDKKMEYEQDSTSIKRLNAYIKVTNANMYLVLVALLLLAVVFLYWGFQGSMPTTTDTYGYVRDDGCVNCYVETHTAQETLGAIKEGMKAELTYKDQTVDGTVIFVDTIPRSKEEVIPRLKYDYFASHMDLYEWNTKVEIQPVDASLPIDSICRVKIVVEEKRPIDFLLQSGE